MKIVIKFLFTMKHYIYLFLLVFNTSLAQNKENYYLKFDSKSEEICQVSKGDRGRFHSIKNTKIYVKNKSSKKDYSYRFYICKELFLAGNEIDTCSIKYLKNIKISKIEELKEIVNKENPLYPHIVFPNLFLVEKINDSTIVKYKVKWKYYIE